MIGIILDGGHGTRLKPLTDHTPKSLIKINGRPILEHIICYMRCAGISEIRCISDMQKPVRPWLEAHEPQIRIVDQDAPIGTGQAVHLALSEGACPVPRIPTSREKRGGEEVRKRGSEGASENHTLSHIPDLSKRGLMVMLGDIIPIDFLLADMVRGCPRYSMLGVNEADDPTRCAVVETDGKSWYLDHKEKPTNPKSNKTLSGCFYFKDASTFYELQHSLMLNKIRSHRGEYDILDTIKHLFRYGESFRCIDNAVLDCGSFEGIRKAETYFQQNIL